MKKYMLVLFVPLMFILGGVEYDRLVPIYRYYHKDNKDHFYTKNANPKSKKWTHQGIEFYAYTEKVHGTVPIYRYYHKDNKDHF